MSEEKTWTFESSGEDDPNCYGIRQRWTKGLFDGIHRDHHSVGVADYRIYLNNVTENQFSGLPLDQSVSIEPEQAMAIRLQIHSSLMPIHPGWR